MKKVVYKYINFIVIQYNIDTWASCRHNLAKSRGLNLDASFVKEILADRKAILQRLWIGKFCFVTPQCGWWTLYMLLWLIQVLSGLMDLKCSPRMSFFSTWCNSVIILFIYDWWENRNWSSNSLVRVGSSFWDLCGALWSKYMGVQCTLLFLYLKCNQKLAVESGILELLLGGFKLFCTRKYNIIFW